MPVRLVIQAGFRGEFLRKPGVLSLQLIFVRPATVALFTVRCVAHFIVRNFFELGDYGEKEIKESC